MDNKVEILSAKFLNDLADEMQKARTKFPSNQHVHAALVEESGEVANALLERDYAHDNFESRDKDVWKECVQTAAMALRVATEGDPSFKYEPPDFFPGIG